MKSLINKITKAVRGGEQYPNLSEIRNRARTMGSFLIDYGITAKDVGLNLLINLVICLAGLVVVLYLAQFLWIGYQSSPMGQQYTLFFGERAALISDFLSRNIFTLSAQMIWIPFSTCFLACCGLRFFHVNTLLYDSCRGIVRILVFGVPLSVLSGWNLYDDPMVQSFEQGMIMGFLPTMFFFPKCVDAANLLIPEMGDIVSDLKKSFQFLKEKLGL